MNFAKPKQTFQDWFTQQWVILWGRKIIPEQNAWLTGPFGNLNGIGEDFIYQLAEKENLLVQRETKENGLLPSIQQLKLTDDELERLSTKVIQFYETTARYSLQLNVNWNPFFKFFGVLVNKLFSKRINQLNIPTKTIADESALKSEIITLTDPKTNKLVYTIWFRTVKATGQVIYSGIYGTCTLPSGATCVKAVFPLPNGNATVIMNPRVEANGALTLDSSGKNFGDAGFYFCLNDAKGNYWSQFVRSFRDRLTIGEENEQLVAQQTLTLWHLRALTFTYKIGLKN